MGQNSQDSWDLFVPAPPCGYKRMFNPDLREAQGLNEDEFPHYGVVVEKRFIYWKGQEMLIIYFSTGFQERWTWRYCPSYRNKGDGYGIVRVVEKSMTAEKWYPSHLWDSKYGPPESWDDEVIMSMSKYKQALLVFRKKRLLGEKPYDGREIHPALVCFVPKQPRPVLDLKLDFFGELEVIKERGTK